MPLSKRYLFDGVEGIGIHMMPDEMFAAFNELTDYLYDGYWVKMDNILTRIRIWMRRAINRANPTRRKMRFQIGLIQAISSNDLRRLPYQRV